MALYDNKYWLLSHIRNSFISTDDTGMCEIVMAGENLPKSLITDLNPYPDSDESLEDEDFINLNDPVEIQLDSEMSSRHRSNTAAQLEKMDQLRKRAAKTRHIKWEHQDNDKASDLFKENLQREIVAEKMQKKSMLSEQMENCTNVPQNPYIQYAKFDGGAQVGIPVRKYRIFLTMLPEEQRNYPMTISCIATAKISELIGLILLQCSTVHGDFPLQSISSYGLYMTEDDGEVDGDFPCLDPKECVAKFGFTSLGLVEHKNHKNVSFETTEVFATAARYVDVEEAHKLEQEENKRLTLDNSLMKAHTSKMEALLYKSYKVQMIHHLVSKVQIQMGISGDKIEIDPVRYKTSNFSFGKHKPVSHAIDSIALCKVTNQKANKTAFKLVYCPNFPHSSDITLSTSLPSPISFDHYEFEAETQVAEEIVQKINLILDIRPSISRKEYIANVQSKKLNRSKSFRGK